MPKRLHVRRLTLVLVIGAALGGATLVSSHNTAFIRNAAQIKVSESERALIAVQALPAVGVKGTTVECGSITNNTPHDVVVDAAGFIMTNSILSPGGNAALQKAIGVTDPVGDNIFPLVVEARWVGGSARIDTTVTITVTAPVPTPPSSPTSTINPRDKDELTDPVPLPENNTSLLPLYQTKSPTSVPGEGTTIELKPHGIQSISPSTRVP